MCRTQDQSGTETIERKKSKLKTPRMYRVIMLNDDYTTMDFVVSVLESIFKKSPVEAVQIMLSVHNRGEGICGIFSKEIAEAKIDLVHKRAKAEGHPLRCSMQEA